ncbi:MAG: sugar-binding protein [Bacteroidota bacterium]
MFKPALSFVLVSLFFLSACQPSGETSTPPIGTEKEAGYQEEPQTTEQNGSQSFRAQRAETAPNVDGRGDDACWEKATWLPLDQRWLGEAYTETDFQGRYKLSWDENYLYLLAEIVDDTLIDIHPDGLDRYWDDDCLEIFIDEDRSKGNHQYNHNAFAYHVSLDNRVVDIGTDSTFRYYDDHLTSRRTQEGKTSTWEVALKVFGDDYRDGAADNRPVRMAAGKICGFALAYCDNDASAERENFIGSVTVTGEDKNRGWIDAGIFGSLELVE